MIEGSIPEISKLIIDMEKIFVAPTPANRNRLISTASRVPSPLIVMGNCPTKVAIGIIARK